jgi:outer membrane protein OmpA-like peptidoglycan-associated protein
MLLVATLATPGFAQAPTSSSTADSTAKDSTAPKKSRFGRFKDKANEVKNSKAVQGVANNKTVQAVANNKMVQGVACTVVPGAAIASAATGIGPCANAGLMATLMSSHGSGAVAALEMMQGAGGISNSAAQLAALKLMKTKGMSGTASVSAMATMMQGNGMSNIAAAAALKNMLKNPTSTGMSASETRDAMKMIEAMGMIGFDALGKSTPSVPSSGPSISNNTPAAAPATAASVWVNYDFVPGERAIYFADFTQDQVGNFPQRLQLVEGNMEVAELGGRRVVRASSASKVNIALPETLPERFTIEIDVINRPSLAGADFYLRGSVGRIDDKSTSIISWGADGVALLGGGGGEVKLVGDAMRQRYQGKPAQLRILGDGKYIKVYLDEKRLANVPNADFKRSNILHLVIDARSDENAAYISRIRVAESRKSMYDDLAASGHVATQGILFDTGSDKLRPESTPTLKQIAGMLESHADLKLRIEGHTDNVGDKNANRTLSDKRAAAVKASLINDYHVNKGRLDSKGLGDSKPAGDNATAEGRSNNRRVELVKI